jgi:mono/diheme cytochrome c family protein
MLTLRSARHPGLWLLFAGVAATAAGCGRAPDQSSRTASTPAPAATATPAFDATPAANAMQQSEPVPAILSAAYEPAVMRSSAAPVREVRANQRPAPLAPPPPPAAEFASLTTTYCVSCHSDKLKTAGLSLQGLDLATVPEHADVWEKVMRKMRTGEMPPPMVRNRPDTKTETAFASYLESSIDYGAYLHPNPGRTPVHRLNRAEYSNAIRDLLAVDVKPGDWLPVDDSGYGFDNIAAVLSTSPALLERYMSAGRKISRFAVGDLTLKPIDEIYDAQRDPVKGSRNEQLNEDLPFGSRAGMSVEHYFPVDAEYTFTLRFAGGRGAAAGAPDDPTDANSIRIPVRAGLHTVGATSPRENPKPEAEAPAGGRGGGGGAAGGAGAGSQLPTSIDLRLDGARVKRFDVFGGAPEPGRLTIGGPYKITGRGNTPSRAKIFICHPAKPTEESACARRILTNLAHHAFRRPVTSADVDPIYAFYQTARKTGDFESGVEDALRAILVSPEFLFRIENDPSSAQTGQVFRVTDLELASRLSFFLWSSIPDDELLAAAEQGKLKDPAVLRHEVVRMLDDPRSDALVSNFAGQWLHLRNVETVKPDAGIFSFDEALRESMIQETTLLVGSIVKEDRSLLDLLDADYTFLNQRLAEHYGVPHIYGSQFRRVTVTDQNRRGLLGQGSILTVTSYPNRTSVVQRGKWVLENLLGTPPPPPPPDVPPFQAAPNGKVLTMREAMQVHRANPTCAACHGRMDPIGFALENFDGVGKWRNEDAGKPIDNSGKLPDGTEFQGPAGLRQLMLTKYKDDFVRTGTEKLLTYALGRGVEYSDYATIRAIDREAARDNYRISALILAVVNSTPFQMRRASES